MNATPYHVTLRSDSGQLVHESYHETYESASAAGIAASVAYRTATGENGSLMTSWNLSEVLELEALKRRARRAALEAAQ